MTKSDDKGEQSSRTGMNKEEALSEDVK